MAAKKKAQKKAPKQKAAQKASNETPLEQEPVVTGAKAERPILIDERDGVCDICAKHKDGFCDKCHKKIANYDMMDGRGYQSVAPTHFHITTVEGLQARQVKHGELCVDCYRKHRAEIYPGEKWEPYVHGS